ncbi:MAG: exopolysaccharide biosynthesis polyprenyl glycosylphosphotransferase [Verrucomicrobiales bacterium]
MIPHAPAPIAAAPSGSAISPAERAAPLGERLTALAFAGDALMIAAGLLVAYWARFVSAIASVGVEDIQMTLADYTGHLIFGGISLAFFLVNMRVYDPRNLLAIRHTVRLIFRAGIIWLVAYLGISLILKFNPPISRIYCAFACVFTLFFVIAWRRGLYAFLRQRAIAERLRQRAVFIGWGPDCSRAERWLDNPASPIAIAGVVRPPSGALEGDPPQRVRVLGDYDDFRQIVGQAGADLVLVSDRNLDRRELHEVAEFCEKEMVDFKLVPTCFQVLLSGLHLESLSGMPVLGVTQLPMHTGLNFAIKRLVDIAGALVGLAVSAPLIAVFGFLIYRESPGSIFYRQRRIGRHGEVFEIIKLRSMKLNAEAGGKVGWTVKDDPRRLRVGEFMRKWNIDEVPQFWNVLKGEMSLVGPRPERPELIANFKEEIPHYNARHSSKPGITGWAQVNGLRGDTDLRERIKFDLHYIENWSLLYDFQIMALTFFNRGC